MLTLCNLSGCLRDDVVQLAEPDELMKILHENLFFDYTRLNATSQTARWDSLYQTVTSQSKLISDIYATSKGKSNTGNNHFTRANPKFEQNMKSSSSSTSKPAKSTGWCIYALANHFFPQKNNPCGKAVCTYNHNIPTGVLSDDVLKSMLKSASTLDKNPELRDRLVSTLAAYGRK